MNHQLDIFQTHAFENTPSMQKHLDENRGHFGKQCRKVFDILMSGERLTVRSAMLKHNISSAPRRFLDLKNNGVLFTDDFIREENGKAFKIWYMTREQIEYNKKFNQVKQAA